MVAVPTVVTVAVAVVGVMAGAAAGAAATALVARWWVVRRTTPGVVRAQPRVGPGSAVCPGSAVGSGAAVGSGSGVGPAGGSGRLEGAEVAVVLGAGLRPDGSVTELLARRVEAGAALYHQGVVSRLVMSGAVVGGQDEPAAMAHHAEGVGVPAEAIELDRLGVTTADTCRQLVARGLATRDGPPVVLVTQEFHIHRALYLAARAGVPAVGYASPDAEVRPAALSRARIREVPAAAKAVFVTRF